MKKDGNLKNFLGTLLQILPEFSDNEILFWESNIDLLKPLLKKLEIQKNNEVFLIRNQKYLKPLEQYFILWTWSKKWGLNISPTNLKQSKIKMKNLDPNKKYILIPQFKTERQRILFAKNILSNLIFWNFGMSNPFHQTIFNDYIENKNDRQPEVELKWVELEKSFWLNVEKKDGVKFTFKFKSGLESDGEFIRAVYYILSNSLKEIIKNRKPHPRYGLNYIFPLGVKINSENKQCYLIYDALKNKYWISTKNY